MLSIQIGRQRPLAAAWASWPTLITVAKIVLAALLCIGPSVALAAEPIQYKVDLRSTETHEVQVEMMVAEADAGTALQIPAWNALYQMRDFVKDVKNVRGECDGQLVSLGRVDVNTWRGPNRVCGNLAIRYSVFANEDGPFDSMLDRHHAFLNLAMMLFYLPHERERPVQIKFQLPAGWRLATLMEGDGEMFHAANYDALVDSPVDAGHFEEASYTQRFLAGGSPVSEEKRASIRVVIDANPKDYSLPRILESLRNITNEETRLMQDLPFDRYTFILQFPRDGGSTGGMEHRNGAAISIPAADIRSDESYLDNVAAHEFFHLWNVKRIRPQALEPVDYIKGNDTRDLWFCEGLTNTYAELTLVRSGLIDHKTFYDRVATAIQVLQTHAARHEQSAETSGREAWLEKYSDYNRLNRSISYYNKGELLGYLLDLGIRRATNNHAGLDDLMHRLNRDFAQRGRTYSMTDVAAIVAELAPSFDFGRFLAEDVRGTQELDFATSLGYTGLNMEVQTKRLAAPGFSVAQGASGYLEVDSVDEGSEADRAGLVSGDVVTMADGEPLGADAAETMLKSWKPDQMVELQVTRAGEVRTLNLRIGTDEQLSIRIKENAQASHDQIRVRDGWLTGTTHSLSGQK